MKPKFAKANADFTKKHGTPPPAIVFELHPAFEPLADAIRQATWRAFRGVRSYQREWCAEQARHVLQELVTDDGRLTEGGGTAEELAEDYASHTFTHNGVNAAVTRIVIALLSDAPPSDDGPLLAAWQAVRACPAPVLSHWHDAAPELNASGVNHG